MPRKTRHADRLSVVRNSKFRSNCFIFIAMQCELLDRRCFLSLSSHETSIS